MRIHDYQIPKCRRRRDLWKRCALLASYLDMDDELVLLAVQNARRAHNSVEHQQVRTRNLQGVLFNLTHYPNTSD